MGREWLRILQMISVGLLAGFREASGSPHGLNSVLSKALRSAVLGGISGFEEMLP